MMPITIVEILSAIEKEGNFRKAALTLGVTQPYLSQVIQRLEKECRGLIVDRYHKPFKLTELGRYYLESRRRIRNIEEEIEQFCSDHANLRTGKLRVASNGERTNAILINGVSAFAKQHPGIYIELTLEHHLEEIADLLLSGEAEVGVLFEYLLKKGLNAYPLFRERYLFAVPDNKDFADVGERYNIQGQYPYFLNADYEKLSKLPILQTVLHHERTALLSRVIGRNLQELNMDVRQLGTRLEFVASGICTAVCQETLIGPYEARNRCRFLSLEGVLPTQTVVIAWNDHVYQSHASKIFCTMVRDSLKAQKDISAHALCDIYP